MNLTTNYLLKIFDCLELNEIINCRTVCKKWKKLIDNFILNELIIFVDQKPFISFWSYNNSNFKSNKSINVSSLSCLYDDYFKSIFKNIKKLHIDTITIKTDLIEALKFYNKIEHLEIRSMNGFIDGELELENLKTFYLQNSLIGNLFIKSNSLNTLSICNPYKDIKFLNSLNTIKILQCFKFDNWINLLKNLEILICKDVDLPIKILNFNNLKEIHVYNYSEKNYLEDLIKQKNRSKKLKLEIYYKGITFQKFLLESFYTNYYIRDKLTESLFILFYENQSKLATVLPFFNEISYTDLIGDYTEKMDKNFFNKLKNVTTISIYIGIENEDKFINFLKYFPNLRTLILKNVQFEKKFFYILPKLCPNLNILEFHSKQINLENYNFVFDLKNLKQFFNQEEIPFL